MTAIPACCRRAAARLAKSCAQNGYMTAWIGKNHNTPTWENSETGPFDRWANGLGFDYFYGFNAGDMNQWNPVLYENRNLVPASNDPNYHLTTDIADHAIAWMQQVKSIAPDRPFFLYVAPGATHSPHQRPRNGSTSSRANSTGLGQLREETLARQKKLGVVPQDTKLTPRPEGLPAWDSLNADQKRLYARMMEVFAGYGPHCDHEMGRIVEAVRASDADNTLIIYIISNTSAEKPSKLRQRKHLRQTFLCLVASTTGAGNIPEVIHSGCSNFGSRSRKCAA